jgi:hypothetical protein
MQRLRHELIMNIRDVAGRVIMHPQMKIWFYVPSCPHVCYINMLSAKLFETIYELYNKTRFEKCECDTQVVNRF